jgi:glycosyltransferase involved in cell wall biosynthesis
MDMEPLKDEADKVVFLVWAAPSFGSSRSRLLSQELGIGSPLYLSAGKNRSDGNAPLRYLLQGWQTLRILAARKAKVVLVQSPPSFSVWFVALYCWLTGGQYIVDAHSDAFQRQRWMRPEFVYRWLARHAMVTIVTDEYFRTIVNRWGGEILVLRDPVTVHHPGEFPINGRPTVTFVNTFNGDEPLEEVLQAAAGLPHVDFYITGKAKPEYARLTQSAPANVRFTGYLPADQYYGLLQASHIVMSLTTRDHTLQCGACEALSLSRPIITSDWPLLREYFSHGTVHVDNSGLGIQRGVERLLSDHPRYEEEISRLRRQRRQEWEAQISHLAGRIRQAVGNNSVE